MPDPIPTDWPEDKRKAKKNTFELNARIQTVLTDPHGTVVVMMKPDFEGVAGISRSREDRVGKPLTALEHFAGKFIEGLPKAIPELVRNVYTTGGRDMTAQPEIPDQDGGKST